MLGNDQFLPHRVCLFLFRVLCTRPNCLLVLLFVCFFKINYFRQREKVGAEGAVWMDSKSQADSALSVEPNIGPSLITMSWQP